MTKKVKIHKEGHKILFVTGVVFLLITLAVALVLKNITLYYITAGISLVIFAAFASFFRIPTRNFNTGDRQIIAPADGRVVVIEETDENEYFKDRRIQVSIFMSPANVHVNRNPVSGVVKYQKYHPGKYPCIEQQWLDDELDRLGRFPGVCRTGQTDRCNRRHQGSCGPVLERWYS